MADSDIQFLGNWSSQEASSNSSFVSAIVLTPVYSGSTTPSTPLDSPRTYSRAQTSVVRIGRVGGPDLALATADDKAGFINPVMSRNHAKITFADSGSAFLIDTNSHHGTWVARDSGSQGTFKLAPESPLQLHDGDNLTFGKEVQKNGVCHGPLTVAVKLLHTTTAPTSSPISISSTPTRNLDSPKPRNRFGLDPFSESESSESETESAGGKDPCTGPNSIRVDLPFTGARIRPADQTDKEILALDSPSLSNCASFASSMSSSPASTQQSPATSQRSPSGMPCSLDSPDYSPAPNLVSPPPGLELEGMGSQLSVQPPDSDMSVNMMFQPDDNTPNVEVSPTPPWRRVLEPLPGFSFGPTRQSPIPAPLPQIQPRRIGRLFNPLWLRSMRTSGNGEGQGSGEGVEYGRDEHGHGHGHGYGHGHGRGRRGRLDADSGLWGKTGSELKDEVDKLGESVAALRTELEAVKAQRVGEDGSQFLHHAFSARLDNFASQLQVLQDTNTLQPDINAGLGQIAAYQDTLASLKEDVNLAKLEAATLKSGVATLRIEQRLLVTDVGDLKSRAWQLGQVNRDVAILKDDVGALKGDSEAIRDDSAVLKVDTENNVEMLTGDLEAVRVDVRELGDDIFATRGSVAALKADFGNFRGEFVGLQGDVETLRGDYNRADAATRKIAGDLQELKTWRDTSAQDNGTKLREELKAEILQALRNQDVESTPVSMKRKCGHDEAFASSDPPASAPTPMASRPRKRLRVVADYAAVGVVGALGAWLGLAFL